MFATVDRVRKRQPKITQVGTCLDNDKKIKQTDKHNKSEKRSKSEKAVHR